MCLLRAACVFSARVSAVYACVLLVSERMRVCARVLLLVCLLLVCMLLACLPLACLLLVVYLLLASLLRVCPAGRVLPLMRRCSY